MAGISINSPEQSSTYSRGHSMEEQLLGGLLKEGVLGIVIIALGIAVIYLFREVKKSWEDRLVSVEESRKTYVELNIETLSTLTTLSKLLQEVETNVEKLETTSKN